MSRDCKNENATLELLLKIQKMDMPLEANRIGESILLGTDSVKEIIEALEFKKSFHPAEVGEALEYVDKLLYGQSGYEKRIPVKMLGDIIKQTLIAQARELEEMKKYRDGFFNKVSEIGKVEKELAEKDIKIKRYIELNNKSITLDCEYDEFERLEKELSSDE